MGKFEYSYYRGIINLLKQNGYSFDFFDEDENHNKSVILRHDVDISLEYAYEFAKIEFDLGVASTYFVLLTSDFYNVFSSYHRGIIHDILALGHKVYLHFDSTVYTYSDLGELKQLIEYELSMLKDITKDDKKIISFHRPIKELLNTGISKDIISAYDKRYFSGYKYISDSRMKWHEDPMNAIHNNEPKIQLLTHPFWYREVEQTPADIIKSFEKEKGQLLLNTFQNNISDFSNFLKGEGKL